MIFTLKADIDFEAKDIDDALLFLEKHWNEVRLGKEELHQFLPGEIHIKTKESA